MDIYRKFVAELARGGLPEPSPAELNGLLHWLVGRSNDAAKAVERAFIAQGIAGDMARRRTLVYLDRTLFRNSDDYYRLFGLTPACSFNAIRRRHKQLLQVFHPDRHKQDRAWFTEKTEAINLAYAYLRANHGKATARKPSATIYGHPAPPYEPPVDNTPRPGVWLSIADKKNRLRRALKARLGSPRTVERRVYVVLYSVPVAVILLVYLNHAASPVERPEFVAAKEASGEPVPAATTKQAPARRGGWKPVDSTMVKTDGGAPSDRIPPGERLLSAAASDETSRAVHSPLGAPGQLEAAEDADPASVQPMKVEQPLHPPLGIELKAAEPGDSSPVTARSDTETRPDTAATISERAPARTSTKSESVLDSEQDPLSPPEKIEQQLVVVEVDGWKYWYENPVQHTPRQTNRPTINHLVAVKALLNQYQLAYNTSNARQLSRLFHEDAVGRAGKDNHGSADSSLAVFGEADRTKISIKNPQVQQIDGRRLNVTADYSVDRTSTGGGRSTENGQLEMNLVMVDGKPRIRQVTTAGFDRRGADAGRHQSGPDIVD